MELTGDKTVKKFKCGGYDCEITFASGLNYCGYVFLPRGHRYYGKDYDEIPMVVHGGLTFASEDSKGNWVIGFDCAHSGDYLPYLSNENDGSLHHWTVEEVENEIKSMIPQL